MRCITILGLAKDLADLNGMKGEIWTLNDFYCERVYGVHPPFPIFKPKYVFQVHKKHKPPDDKKYIANMQKIGRWTGDWKQVYNDHCENVVATYKIPGVKNCHVFDMKRAKKEFGSWCLTSTASFMLIWAFWEGVDYIRFNAFPQIDENYNYQMPGTHLLIEHLRGMGMLIHNPYEHIWLKLLKGFNWKEFVKIDGTYGYDKLEVENLYAENN